MDSLARSVEETDTKLAMAMERDRTMKDSKNDDRKEVERLRQELGASCLLVVFLSCFSCSSSCFSSLVLLSSIPHY